MVYTCFACKWRSDSLPKRSFHKFPNDDDLKQKWLDLIGQSHASVGSRTTLCSIHFADECYRISLVGEKRLLREGSLPSLFLETGREMQAKWKALRDSYRRVIRIQERDRRLGIEPSRRSKYYFFDQLNFLADHCGPKGFKKDSKASIDCDMDDTNDFSNEGSVTWEKDAEVEIKVEPEGVNAHFLENFDLRPKTPEPARDDLNQRLMLVLEDMVKLQKTEKEDVMGDKGFLLSLLPFMQNLSNEDNLKVRIEFMKVLQNFPTQETDSKKV